MFNETLLPLLRCPLTQQPLTLATAAMLRGRKDRAGNPLECALLREDGAMLYPIRGGIPVLLAEEAVPTR